MNSQAIPDNNAVDLDPASQTGDDSSQRHRRWWGFFRRSDRPSRSGSWLGRFGSRNRFLDEFREEKEKLVSTIEQLAHRIEAAELKEKRSLTLDPMPVMKGIERISTGQQEVSTAIQSLNEMMERSGQTDQQLIAAMGKVDKTLGGVKTTQTETVGALVNVGEQIDHATLRFEELFERMSEAEQVMAQDYRKLQHRTLLAIAIIAAVVIAVLGLFMSAPWL